MNKWDALFAIVLVLSVTSCSIAQMYSPAQHYKWQMRQKEAEQK